MKELNFIGISFKANNSNGSHELTLFEPSPGEFSFILTGEYKGNPIQIDFTDDFSIKNLQDMKAQIELMIDQ
jgi:hypothetical protein